jgi:hypothetical protein
LAEPGERSHGPFLEGAVVESGGEEPDAEDVQFTSPAAAAVVPESGGVIRGIAALRAYWAAALPLVPDLHFDLVEVLATVDGLTIVNRNQRS